MSKHQPQSLLEKAKEQEKRYNWLGAIDNYKKASNIALDDRNFSAAADFHESIGYCFFRAALQAKTNEQFIRRMTFSAKNYELMASQLQKLVGEEARINHAKAMVAYTSSWIEPDFSKMTAMLDEWWTIENKVLSTYEKKGNLGATGRIYNNLMEYSADRRIFFKAEEYEQRRQELVNLGDKAIRTLSKTHDNYELARAYCWSAWYNGLISRAKEKGEKNWLVYSKKALSLSEKLGDAWLIGWSHNARMIGSLLHEFASVLDSSRYLTKQGEIAKDNYMITIGKWTSSLIISLKAQLEEDPDKQKKLLREALKLAQEAMSRSQIISFPIGILLSQNIYVTCLNALAFLELSIRKKRILFSKAAEVGRKSFEYASRAYGQGQVWTHVQYPMDALSESLFWLSKTEKRPNKKIQLLQEALKYRKEAIAFLRNILKVVVDAPEFFHMGLIQSELARTEARKKEKIKLLNKAIISFEDSLKAAKTKSYRTPTTVLRDKLKGTCNLAIGQILTEIYTLTKENTILTRALTAYNDAYENFKKAELPTYSAESKWKASALHDKTGDYTKAAETYNIAANNYAEAARKIPHLERLYKNHSLYMQAWSEIEQAKQNHAREDYSKSTSHYETAAKLHESSEPYSYLSANYFAWAQVEKAENISRKENPQAALQAFQKAYEQFEIAEESIKTRIDDIQAVEEKEMATKLVKASDLRRMYCQVRMSIEEGKILEKKGDYDQSSKNYRSAVKNLEQIIRRIKSPQIHKEMMLLLTLCQAWQKMSIAEKQASPEIYLEASRLFEQSKEYSPTKRTSLWALGNSNFCKGLAAEMRYQNNLDLPSHSLAKSFMKSAANYYLQAGFKNASEYAKATQRLFDAYLFMNQAEAEADQEKRAKQYQMTENLLQIAAGSFMKAKQPEKTAQVQQLLKTVKEEKALAVSLADVMHAPTIASSTMSFAAPSPTNEASVGLEQFEHANVQANLIAHVKQVKVGESFCLSVEFVNAGKEPALLMRVEDFVPLGFIVVEKPEIYRLEDSCLNMKGKEIAPLKLVEAKLVLQPSKKGVYQVKPAVYYLNELGQTKSLQVKSVEIKVKEVILPNRVSTGTKELDSLLLGGIPESYAVVLTGSPSDEREMLVRNFLEAGTTEGQTSFYVTTEAVGLEPFLENPSFHLFLCNPKPKVVLPDQPNVIKLRSKTDINNLNMALAKASHDIKQKSAVKRACIETVSDVLLRQGPEVTRRWLSELITDLSSRGFTVLAVLDSSMHPADQANAVLNLFDGEISLFEIVDGLKCRKSVRVKKLRDQDYIENPICLTRQK